jgi:hypothetical protein
MIPNRDSIPQNHPNPKDAVSKLDGATASIGGIARDPVLEAAIKEPSTTFEPLFPCAFSITVPPIIKHNIPSIHEVYTTLVKLLFVISIILSYFLKAKIQGLFSHHGSLQRYLTH